MIYIPDDVNNLISIIKESDVQIEKFFNMGNNGRDLNPVLKCKLFKALYNDRWVDSNIRLLYSKLLVELLIGQRLSHDNDIVISTILQDRYDKWDMSINGRYYDIKTMNAQYNAFNISSNEMQCINDNFKNYLFIMHEFKTYDDYCTAKANKILCYDVTCDTLLDILKDSTITMNDKFISIPVHLFKTHDCKSILI